MVFRSSSGKARPGLPSFPRPKRKRRQASPSPVRVLHFALRADRKNFERAQQELKQRGIAFHFEDHGIAHSIYFRDPDGHELEITTYEVE